MGSVIAEHYDNPWVSAASYGTASLVGLARIYHDHHYVSDVLAGALIGTTVGTSIVRHNRARAKVTFAPVVEPGFYGLAMNKEF